jgi:hypothetical protein
MTTDAITQITLTQTVSKKYFPVQKAIGYDYVRSVFGEATINKADRDLDPIKDRLWQVRKDAKGWGSHRVESMIHAHAVRQGILAANYKGLRAVWRKDGTKEFAAKLWMSCYGDFDEQQGWERELEEEYMGLRGYEYEPDPPVTPE